MDQQALRESAERLQALLAQYAPTNEIVSSLQDVLTPWIDAALAGRIQEPVDTRDIPGGRTFAEFGLRDDTLPGFESAYAAFKMEASGGEPEYLKIYRKELGLR